MYITDTEFIFYLTLAAMLGLGIGGFVVYILLQASYNGSRSLYRPDYSVRIIEAEDLGSFVLEETDEVGTLIPDLIPSGDYYRVEDN